MADKRPNRPALDEPAREGWLRPLPALTLADRPGPGICTLQLGKDRHADLLVPSGRDLSEALPLVVMLHGAGGRADHMISLLFAAAEQYGLLVLAPQSLGRTWDVIGGDYGPDVEAVSDAMGWVAERLPVDADRLAIGGFSDGASYALSLGLTNGELFSDILAFSPGFAAPASRHGLPRIFISHGTRDEVLPIDRCGRVLASRFTQAGFPLDYREFDGGHVVPREMIEAAVIRFLGSED